MKMDKDRSLARDEEVIGFLTQRNDDRGQFDELVGKGGFLHFEMMADDHLWIGIDHPTDTTKRIMVNVWIGKNKTLRIKVEEDNE